MRVLVCGDAMIDRYWFGEVDRISPEAPVPVVAIARTEERRGGAANVAENIAAMGVDIRERYSHSYPANPVVKLRVVANRQQVCRIDFDKPQTPLTAEEVADAAQDCKIVVLSDYGKGSLAKIAAIIGHLKFMGRTVMVDPKGRRFTEYAGADVIKPNLAELRVMIGGWTCEEDMHHKVKAMQRAAKIPVVLLTRGPDGMTVFDGAVTQIPCAAREVFDVSGAGDTALAAFAAGTARGMTILQSADLANRAAGIAVGRFGTAVITEEDLNL